MHTSEEAVLGKQEQTLYNALIPDMVIPPGGHAEILCAKFPGETTIPQEDSVNREPLNSLEAFMVREEVAEFFRCLPIEERKTLEGLEGYALATAIEEMYLRSKLAKHYETLPLTTRRKLDKLPETDKLRTLAKLSEESAKKAYATESQLALDTAAYVKKNMAPEQQSLFAPYPHDLARRSVFFIEEYEGQKRERLEEFVIGSGSWGFTVYDGKKLYTADEKAWVVLLGLAGEQKRRGVIDWHVVKGSVREFLREAGLAETGHYSQRFLDSIEAMHSGVFRFQGKDVVKANGQPKKRAMKDRVEGYHLISNYSVDNTTGQFVVILDRSFIETFIAQFHMYARLDIQKFCRQPPTASALHRFFAGHTPGTDGCIRMTLFLVAKSINMLNKYPQTLEEWPDPEVKYQKKRIITRALAQLVKDETFGPRTSVKTRKRGEDDLVIIDFHVASKIAAAQKKKKIAHK